MRDRIPGETTDFLAVGRLPDIDQHIAHVRREFAGQPELCFTLATQIINIRREHQLAEYLADFTALVRTPVTAEFLAKTLSLRWLISVADTLADHGTTDETATALILVVLVNLLKLAETERLLLVDPSYSEERMQTLLAEHPRALFGGLIAYHLHRGDMPRNLFARLAKATSSHPFLGPAYLRIIAELRNEPNLLSRLAELNPEFFISRAS